MATVAAKASGTLSKIQSLLEDKAEFLLDHVSTTVDKKMLHVPGPDFIDRVWANSNRNNQTLRSQFGIKRPLAVFDI